MTKQSLGLFDSTMIVAGSMIGSGVFIVSADIARNVGSPELLLLVWALAGVLTLIAASSYGELAGMMPEAGGQYVYLREAFGKMTGFLYGWTLFTVIQTGTIAAVAMAFAKFTGVLFPVIDLNNIVVAIGPVHLSSVQILAMSIILLLTYINTKGLHLGKLLQNFFTSTKLIAVLGLAIVGFIVAAPEGSALQMRETLSKGLTWLEVLPFIGVAMVGTIFSSDAWNNITFVSGEVKDPAKNIPKALVFGVLIVTFLYLTVNVVYLRLLPFDGIQHALNDRVGTAAVQVMFGNVGEYIMAVLIMISTFGCNNGLILAGSRAYAAMASDKLFFKGAAQVNAHGVPSTSLWIQALWASLLCLTGSYSELLEYVVIAALLFYILSIIGIFRLRITKPNIKRPIKAFGYPVLPAMYIIVAGAICICLLFEQPKFSSRGIGLVLLGIPVYFIWNLFSKKEA